MKKWCYFLLLLTAIASCKKNVDSTCTDDIGLYHSYEFPVGVSLEPSELDANDRYRNIAAKQFNSITPENCFKAVSLHPQEGVFDWSQSEILIEFCKQNNKRIHGHTLIWHEQLPEWIKNYQGSRADWENLMKNHIQTIVKHFKGKVTGWDVVNEAFYEDGTLRNTIWHQKIGDSYIEKAFVYAQEADPDAKLFYNDFSLEWNPVKRNAVLSLLNNLRLRGVKVNGIGLQMHISTVYPDPSQVAEALNACAAADYLIHLSEIDVSVNPLNKSDFSLTEKLLKKQAEKMTAVIGLYKQLSQKYQYGITFWGVSDNHSWIRSYFNRNDYPLLYDDNYMIKPIYCSLKL